MNQRLPILLLILLTLTGAASAQSNMSADPVSLTPQQLKLWKDPAFQKAFTQSYIAETEIEPQITVVEREKMQQILELISSEQVEQAIALLQESRGEAASAVFDFTLANIHFQAEQLEQAAEIYKVAVRKYPKFRRAWKNLALIHVRQGQFAKAIPALTKVIELGGGDALTYGLLGFAYSHAENFLSAESAYRMAILLDPKTMDWQMGLARAFFKQERYADAVALTKQLIIDNPDRADLWLLQANAYIGLKKPMNAAENYELVDRLGKSTPASLYTLADIYVNEEIFNLAVDAYIRAMEMDESGNPKRLVRAAKVLTAQGAMDQTQKLLDNIDKILGEKLDTEQKKDLLKLRARLAVAAGSGDEEARVLEQIVELDPLDGEALILLGQHATRNGNHEKAVFYYERAASIEAFEADAKVRHAQLLVQQSKYAEALPLLRRAQQINPRQNIQEYLEQVERVAKAR